MIKIVLPIPKRAKPRGGIGKYGNMTHSTKGYREWQDDGIKLIRCLNVPVITDIYSLHITFYRKGRGDLDNLAGGVMDMFVKSGVIKDDDWVTIPNLIIKTNPEKKDQIDIYFCQNKEESIKLFSEI